jgi:hypothetical protein
LDVEAVPLRGWWALLWNVSLFAQAFSTWKAKILQEVILHAKIALVA